MRKKEERKVLFRGAISANKNWRPRIGLKNNENNSKMVLLQKATSEI